MRNEIRPLTGIRGVAAFMVMLYHFHFNPAFSGDNPLIVHKAYLSVDLFYILSGFVLALRYGGDFAAGIARLKVARFLVGRFGRIYPAYFVISLIYVARWVVNLQGHHAHDLGVYDIVANIFLMQGWGINALPLCDDSWSVSVEAFAYLLFPMLIAFFVHRGALHLGALGLLGVSGLVYVAMTGGGASGPLDMVDKDSPLPLLRCVAEFSLGVVACGMAQQDRCRKILESDRALIVVLAAMAVPLGFMNGDAVFVLMIPLLVICLSYNGRLAMALFGNKLVYHLGIISYSLYLLHPLVRDIAARLLAMTHRFTEADLTPAFIILGIALTWLAAIISQRLVEVPGRRAVDRMAQRFLPG